MITAAIIAALIAALYLFIEKILFWIGKGLCTILGFLTDLFEMVAGLDTVIYKGNGTVESKLLIKVFFGNSTISTIYWGMALIGIVMCVGFTIAAVIRKSGDAGDKMKQSMGDILRNCFKGITLILLMNFIISATISISQTLLDRINYLFLNAQNFDMSYDVTFDSEDYACMARSLNTIGNYSLNASYNSRYNLNSCYNDIREDLKRLGDKGKFDVTYISTTYDEDGESVEHNTWQSVLENIYRSVDDIDEPQPLDEYNTKLSEALLEAMDIIKNDASFEALDKYHVSVSSQQVGEMVSLDRMVMLIGSLYGNGANLDKGSGMTDYLRGPYYYGQKDIYSFDRVKKDFDMDLGSWMYLTVIITAIFFIREMLAMVFNAVARIFNMLLLYLTAPPFIAITPLDDGGKLKQWTTAFIIQSFGLFGTVISMRLLMIFIPILFSGDIQFFSGARLDIFARIIVMYAAMFTARKASGMIVGILADNAGWQAISAGDVGADAKGSLSKVTGAAKAIGGAIGGMALGAVGKGLGAADTAIWNKITGSGKDGDKKSGSKGTPGSKLDVGGKSSSGTNGGQGPKTQGQSSNAQVGQKSQGGAKSSTGAKQPSANKSRPASVGANGKTAKGYRDDSGVTPSSHSSFGASFGFDGAGDSGESSGNTGSGRAFGGSFDTGESGNSDYNLPSSYNLGFGDSDNAGSTSGGANTGGPFDGGNDTYSSGTVSVSSPAAGNPTVSNTAPGNTAPSNTAPRHLNNNKNLPNSLKKDKF